MTRPMKRIATASGLTVMLIAVALAATIWSYRNAVDARDRALDAASEIAVAHAAEAYLFREREAMDEYLLTHERGLRTEIESSRARFRLKFAQVGLGEPNETLLVGRALETNEALLASFGADAAATAQRLEAGRRLEAKLSASEDRILIPIRALQSINDRQVREARQAANSSSRRALLAGILAGAIAIVGGLGFAFYAVRLIREIASRNEQLRELDRVKDDFVASVSHELRTPLTSIRGYLELVLDGEAGELTNEQCQFLSIVDRNADRLLRVVGDLLFVAQVDAGRIAIERAPTDVDELVHEAVEAARPIATEEGVELDLELDGLGAMNADRARLAQVIDNLISNAVKFTPPGGRVEVRSAREGDLAVLEVSDTGIGISPEDQDRVFQRFFRTDEAIQHAVQGTGLGLSIVQAIVEAHDGGISVASMPGAGTTFRIELPLEPERVMV